MLGQQADGMIQVGGFKYHNSTDLLFGFGERAVDHGNLAAAPSQCGSISGFLQALSTCIVTILPKLIIVAKTLVHKGLPFAFGKCFPNFFIHVSKTDVFHNDYLLSWRITCVTFSDASNRTHS